MMTTTGQMVLFPYRILVYFTHFYNNQNEILRHKQDDFIFFFSCKVNGGHFRGIGYASFFIPYTFVMWSVFLLLVAWVDKKFRLNLYTQHNCYVPRPYSNNNKILMLVRDRKKTVQLYTRVKDIFIDFLWSCFFFVFTVSVVVVARIVKINFVLTFTSRYCILALCAYYMLLCFNALLFHERLIMLICASM